MLNISATPAVSWPAAPSAAVAPVSAVTAVQPTQGRSREAQTETGQGRGHLPERARHSPGHGAGRVAAPHEKPMVEAAPLLPYKPDGSVERTEKAPPEAAQAKQDQTKEEVEQRRLKLQEVLSSVWKASAAVVDIVLGRDLARSVDPGVDALGNQSDTAPDLSAVTASMIKREVVRPARAAIPETPALPMPSGHTTAATATDASAAVEVVVTPPPQTVVSYDENGASNLMPLEAGSLVSERV